MILLKIDNNDLERFGGLEKLIERIICRRNWELFLTLILEIDINQVSKLIQENVFRKVCKKIDLWVHVEEPSIAKKLLKDGVKKVRFVVQENDVVLKIISEDNFSNIDYIIINTLNFNKMDGLIPTIVQDEDRNILMLAYSSKESLQMAISTRKAIYFSRTRNSIWEKGEESGNFQILKKIQYDCDADALLFRVKQKNNACHTGSYSCFQISSFTLRDLYEIMNERKKFSSITESYTKRLLEDRKLLISKIKEESKEVIRFTDKENLIWEIADLTYFLLVLMLSEEISPDEIINELRSRNL